MINSLAGCACSDPLDASSFAIPVRREVHHIQPHARHPGRAEAKAVDNLASHSQKAALPMLAVINEPAFCRLPSQLAESAA